jgi:hypothetical protein
LRTDILTKGKFKPQLEIAWQWAVQKCVQSVLFGMSKGYASAYVIVRESLRQVGFDEDSLEHLFDEAAPKPKFPCMTFEPLPRVSTV